MTRYVRTLILAAALLEFVAAALRSTPYPPEKETPSHE